MGSEMNTKRFEVIAENENGKITRTMFMGEPLYIVDFYATGEYQGFDTEVEARIAINAKLS